MIRIAAALVALAQAAAGAPGPSGPTAEGKGLIFQGPYLFCGDEQGMMHILYRDRPLIHGMGIFCGINGYTKPNDMEKVAFERGDGVVMYRGKVRGTPVTFEQSASIDGRRIRVRIVREGAWPDGVWGGFQVNIPQVDYAGAAYQVDGKRHAWPAKFTAGAKFPGGRRLECNPGTPRLNIVFESAGGIGIEDHRRFGSPNYVLSIGVPTGSTEAEFFITLPDTGEAPHRALRWSRIGYPLKGEKFVVMEWPRNAPRPADAVRVEDRRNRAVVQGRFGPTEEVGWMQDRFATFDFSGITKPGEYRVVWAGGATGWFPVRESVFADRLWQPTLDFFIPFEMCHASVDLGKRARGRGACHMDDAARVPANFTGPDGFVSYGCEGTPYDAGEHIPLAAGGWHDAGDYDLNVPAQSYVTWMLALAWEEFRPGRDVATLDATKGRFRAGKPDGVPDILQQVEWGATWLLRMQQPDGRVWNGVCENGPWRSGKPVDRITDGKVGTEDDRQVYVDYHADCQLNFVIATAAAARALGELRPELAARCLDASRRAFAYFRSNNEVYRAGSYTATKIHGGERDGSVIAAAIELHLAAGGTVYLGAAEGLAGSLAGLKFDWPLPRDTQTGGFRYAPPFLARIVPKLSDGAFKDAAVAACRRAAEGIATRAAIRPWPLETWEFGEWGNNGTGLARAFDVYWLTKVVPDVLPPSAALRTMLWVFGLHPTCDTVFVSGLGYPETKYLYSCHLHAANGFKPGNVPGAVSPGMGGFWMSGVVAYIDEYGFYGHNEACIYTAAQSIFAVNAMRAMGF